jgi:16S rRNA (cytosine1402-N4)-methyltransferase
MVRCQMSDVSCMLHIPVLLQEVTQVLNVTPGAFIIDGTLGGGGYTKTIAEQMEHSGTILATDLDAKMIERARDTIEQGDCGGVEIRFKNENFRFVRRTMIDESLPEANGLVLDLGFASDQLEGGRGLSFQRDEPLEMTFSDATTPVHELLRIWTEEQLEKIIRNFGEERYARQIARAIKEQEKREPIMTSGQLQKVIASAVPKNYEHGRINPATRTFQALRIAANQELESLKDIITQLTDIVKPGGRVVIVSFHSLEDRIVKQGFNNLANEGRARILTKTPVTASEGEIKNNPRARSAKMRAIEVI